MKKKSKPKLVKDQLESLEIGFALSRQKLIDKIYKKDSHKDYFIKRSFSVHLNKAKKLSSMKFKSDRNLITRIS